ncbi:tetratricopeptide repeat protein [Streptomyces sp. NPDC004610]|uniref:tetratricopeptide repeat protein n=1 Tax=unclassified Streptomyces TaxID=2593676 RepID=UPI0033B27310
MGTGGGSDGDAGTSALTDRLHPTPPPPPPGPDSVGNTIGGEPVFHGPTVQARDIHGGLHFHAAPPPPPAPAPAPTPAPPSPIPRQLPAVTARFLDREADRQVLDEARSGPHPHASPLLVVTGLAGVGKTALVSRWLHEHTGSFPDGHLYADLGGHTTEGPVPPGTVLEAFLIALGVASVPAGTAQRGALWRSVTSGLRLAVLLDNAFTAAQVRPLLLGSPTGLTVVTSRNALTGLRADGARVHRLDGLPTESAVQLLADGGGRRVTHEPAAAQEVVRLCGRLPLAVSLASAQLAVRPHRPLSALARSLSLGPGTSGALRVDGEAVFATALDLSYGLLPPTGAALYRRLGLLPADRLDPDLMTAVLGDDEDPDGGDPADRTDDAVQGLVEAHLLEETGPATYRLHDIVRPHARRAGEEFESAEGRERTLGRFVDWCLATAAEAERILTPSHRLAAGHEPPTTPGSPAEPTPAEPIPVEPTPLPDAQAALTWLDTHRNGIMGAIRYCAATGRDRSCWRLVDLAWPLFLRLRPSELWVEAHRLGLDAARRDGSRAGESRMLTSGAIGLRNAGRYPEAAEWYGQALERAAEDGDVRQQAQAISGLGHIRLLTGDPERARAHFEEALRLRESIGYRRGAALTRRRLGETAVAAGDLPEAARQLTTAHEELLTLSESYEATRVLALLGHVRDRTGEREAGLRALDEALERFRSGDTRSEHWEARCLEWLGQAADSRGDTAGAAAHYRAAQALFRRLDPADADRLTERLARLERAD